MQLSRGSVIAFVLAGAAACSGSPSNPGTGTGDSGTSADSPLPPTDSLPGSAVDPCPATPPACPVAPAGLTEGSGFRSLDVCAFPLGVDDTQAAGYNAALDALPATLTRVGAADLVADQNRTATRISPSSLPGDAPGVVQAYTWEAGDESVAYWTPQGVTGTFDSSSDGTVAGHALALVSWYYTLANDPGSTVDKGVRIAIADITNPQAVTYRFALLVEPYLDGTTPTFREVPLHAGGIAWVGDRLYVPATNTGFRVFDMSRILKMDGLDDSIGFDPATGHYNAHSYAYAIPEIERYNVDKTCTPAFSFVSVDRTTTPPSLVSGEYNATSIAGRLYRWPLAADGAMVRTDRARVVASEAWFMGESHIQGGLAHAGEFWLSSSRPSGSAGELDRTGPNTTTTRLGWSDSPEDLAFDPQSASVWSLTEGVSARYLFAVGLAAIQ